MKTCSSLTKIQNNMNLINGVHILLSISSTVMFVYGKLFINDLNNGGFCP